MASLTEWKVPPAYQPRSGDYSFDLDRALSSVVGLHSIIPSDAFTAETLGTERAGNGVVIDDGLVLTIGYLITEAETVWLHLGDGRVMEGHALGFDAVSGFGLVQALGRMNIDPLPIGTSATTQIGDRVVVGGAGGRTRSVASQIAAKQEMIIQQIGMDNPLVGVPEYRNTLARMLETANIADVSNYFKALPPGWQPPPPNNQPTDSQLLAMAQQQKNAADLETDRGKAQTDRAKTARVVGVQPQLRRQVEGHRQARATVLQQVAVALVGLLRRRVARVLAHRPQLPRYMSGWIPRVYGYSPGSPRRPGRSSGRSCSV